MSEARATCANCGTPLTGRYCAACGQKAALLNPTLGHFLSEAAQEITNLDGRIFRSVRFLVTRPGFLTKEIIAGRRASYLAPLRLYLIFSVLAYAFGAAQLDALNVSYTASPGEVVDPAILAGVQRTQQVINDAVNVWLPRAMFVLVPAFAAIVMLLRRKSGLNYPQHLYFALHVQTFWFLLASVYSAFTVLGGYASEMPPFAVSIALQFSYYVIAAFYFVAAFRAVYATTIWGALWRCFVLGLLYALASMVIIFAIAARSSIDYMNGGSS